MTVPPSGFVRDSNGQVTRQRQSTAGPGDHRVEVPLGHHWEGGEKLFRLATALACTGAALLLVTLGPLAGTASASGAFHQIKNVGTGFCVEPQFNGFGAPIIQVRCADGDSDQFQDWQNITPPGTNRIRLQNQGSGLCMFVLDDTGNGTPVSLDECAVEGGDSVSNAEWSSFTRPPNAVSLRTLVNGRDHNLCLSGVSGALSVRTCNNSAAEQRWLL